MPVMTLKMTFDNGNGFQRAIYFRHNNDFYGQFCDDFTEIIETYDPMYLNDAKEVHDNFMFALRGDIGDDDYAFSLSETPIENPDCVVEVINGEFHFQMGNRIINRPLSDWPRIFPR